LDGRRNDTKRRKMGREPPFQKKKSYPRREGKSPFPLLPVGEKEKRKDRVK